MNKQTKRILFLTLMLVFITGCDEPTWNNPHSISESAKKILFASFDERPNTLDPARSYSVNEAQFTAQIYEPIVQYHYLKRPSQLVPLTAVKMPTVTYFDALGNKVEVGAKNIAKSVYTIQIKSGIFYQPHPSFAKTSKGEYRYYPIKAKELKHFHEISDFKETGTRELTAEDYVYQIKRLASPKLASPIFGVMKDHIEGFEKLNQAIAASTKNQDPRNNSFIDLRDFEFSGAKVIDRYTYQINVIGAYPQLKYWLAMPFFSPIPWEADRFYSQPGMAKKNLSFDWYPVGTGPYYLSVNNPNREMVLIANPNFHGERFPSEGEPGDLERGLLDQAGKPLPFVKKVVFSLEKESIPRWNKFLQGYYDNSGIASDNFDQAVHVSEDGELDVTKSLKEKDIRLQTSVEPGIFYLGFNMLDDVVGGLNEKSRKLRQAISIAINYEEFIDIFLNGRGLSSQGPIPPGIFGYLSGKAGTNSYIYRWDGKRPVRKPLDYAKQLLKEAGYPGGRNIKTGEPLILNYDVPAGGGPDDKARLEWIRKQFEKLDIQLNIRSTHYNRFQQKMRTGHAQIFFWGWSADYPDPENFLFLLYGPNGKVKHGGENASNYQNPEFDELFEKMKLLPNGMVRQAMINHMVIILRHDAPWVWGFHPKTFALYHTWRKNSKPNQFANNTLKYIDLDPVERVIKIKAWNHPILWPILLIFILLLLAIFPIVLQYVFKERKIKEKPKCLPT